MIPKLRTNLQLIPAATPEGERVVVVKDPLGLLGETLILSQGMLAMLHLMESTPSRKELQVTLTRLQGGNLITQDEIQKIFDELDEQFLLDTENYQRAHQNLIDDFQKQSIRKAYCAENSYPQDVAELTAMVAETLEKAKGVSLSSRPQAIVAPHIDLRVGLSAYGEAYKVLEDYHPPLVILLGVGHQMEQGLFSVTTKDFETPLGVTKTNKELALRLLNLDSPALAPHDFVHKQEHSLEFQLLFLQHLIPQFEILPILCGSFFPFLSSHNGPGEVPGVQPVLDELRAILHEREALVVAGVDLSHVGPKFGDDQTAEEIVPLSEPHDQSLLESLCQGDGPAFWAKNKKVEDKFHVCGFSTMAGLLAILAPTRGHLAHYQIWMEEETQSSVSFGSVVFEAGKQKDPKK